MNLLLATSQTENKHPYRFAGTGIQVYSFEEAMYHVYHHWKQSIDDITAPGLAAWVHDSLGLTFVAAKMKEVARIDLFSERMLAFLEIIEYFDNHELNELAPEFRRWENRLQWETYKERADDLVNRGEPDKAIALYRRILNDEKNFDENAAVLNNLAVAYMQTDAPDEACRLLKRALALASADSANSNKREENRDLLLHYCEALIAAGHYEEVSQVFEKLDESADVLYLRGELAFGMGQSHEAVSYFEQAIAKGTGDDQYVYRLADVYAHRRQFERALEVLANLIKKDQQNLPCLMKMAEIHNMSDNIPAAVSAIKKAIDIRPGHAELWTRLARYHRLNYDLPAADSAIAKALSLDGSNERARLESARIQKNMGCTKAYQQLLKGILLEFKGRYRE